MLQKRGQITKMQLKKSHQQKSEYWCHFCQISFTSELQPGKDIILCPQCKNDFCQLKTRFNHPQNFKPYQKQPHKKEKNIKKVDKNAMRMSVNQLAQILQIRESENFEVTEEMLGKIRKKVQKISECSVCRMDLQIGEEGIIPRCQHVFHEQCLGQWIKRKNTCPFCRAQIIPDLSKNDF